MSADNIKKLILDCDAGTDDAIALLMALVDTRVKVVAITAVFGNASLKDTSVNVLRVLKQCERLDIPVYCGCSRSLIGTPPAADGYHGIDALGDVILEGIDPVDQSCFQKEHAANAINQIVSSSPGEITLVATGPLTNVALALQLNPQLGDQLADCVVMGGNVRGKGNITLTAEFNFWADPESAYMVLDHLNKRITLASVDVCEEYSFSWDWYDKFAAINTKKSNFVVAIEKKMNDRERALGKPTYVAWDQLAMAVVIDPQVITKWEDVYATVELSGSRTRGQMIVDWQGRLGKTPNVRLIQEINKPRYEELYLKGVDHVTADT